MGLNLRKRMSPGPVQVLADHYETPEFSVSLFSLSVVVLTLWRM